MHPRSVLVRCPRRTRADEKIMAQLFAEPQARDALKPSEAEMGKSGSNLNQIAHVLNKDRSPERIMNFPEATATTRFPSLLHGVHIFSCRLAGANCLKSPRLNV